jgi:hypothetical protein
MRTRYMSERLGEILLLEKKKEVQCNYVGKYKKQTNYNLGYNTEIKEDDRANTVISKSEEKYATFYILMLVSM